jgi:YVTN family beta-propeller protein
VTLAAFSNEERSMIRSGLFLLAALGAPVAAQAPNAVTELLYVVNARSDFLSVIGVPDNRVVGTVQVGRAASGIAATRAGDRLYVAVESGPKVVAIDTVTSKILWSVPVGEVPHHVALSGDGKFLYVCVFSSDRLDIIDTEKRAVVGTVRVGLGPHNVYTSTDGRHIYSGQIHQDNVSVVDTTKQEVIKQIPMGERVRPLAFTKNEKTMYVQLSRLHGFVVVDMASGKQQKIELPALKKPYPVAWPYNVVHGIAVSPDDKLLFADSALDNFVAVYSIPDHKLMTTIPVGDNPNWMSFSADGALLYVSNRGDNNVSVISVRDLKEVTRIPVGQGPQRILTVRVPSRTVSFTTQAGR